MHSELNRKTYSDQTDKFPITPFCGNKYIMILFELNSNNMLSELMRNITAGEMMRPYQKLIDRLREKGIQSKLHLLDNECSEKFKEVIKNNGIKYQLMPPHDQRSDIA